MSDEKKEIEVITGDGKELEISPVYEHIKSDRIEEEKEKKNIVIPKGQNENSNDNKNDNDK